MQVIYILKHRLVIMNRRDEECDGSEPQSLKPATISLDDDVVVFVRQNQVQRSFQINPKHFQKVATVFFFKKIFNGIFYRLTN